MLAANSSHAFATSPFANSSRPRWNAASASAFWACARGVPAITAIAANNHLMPPSCHEPSVT